MLRLQISRSTSEDHVTNSSEPAYLHLPVTFYQATKPENTGLFENARQEEGCNNTCRKKRCIKKPIYRQSEA